MQAGGFGLPVQWPKLNGAFCSPGDAVEAGGLVVGRAGSNAARAGPGGCGEGNRAAELGVHRVPMPLNDQRLPLPKLLIIHSRRGRPWWRASAPSTSAGTVLLVGCPMLATAAAMMMAGRTVSELDGAALVCQHWRLEAGDGVGAGLRWRVRGKPCGLSAGRAGFLPDSCWIPVSFLLAVCIRSGLGCSKTLARVRAGAGCRMRCLAFPGFPLPQKPGGVIPVRPSLLRRIEAFLPGALTRELLSGRVNYPSPTAGSPYHRSAWCASQGDPNQGAASRPHGLTHGGGNEATTASRIPFPRNP